MLGSLEDWKVGKSARLKGGFMFNKISLAVLAVLFFSSVCIAEDDAVAKAKEIKTRSENYMGKELKDYTATILTKASMMGMDFETTSKVAQKNNPGGKNYTKTEMSMRGFSQTTLLNKDGMYIIKGDEAQKMGFINELVGNMDMSKMMDKVAGEMKLDSEEKTYDDMPCYLIRQNGENLRKIMMETQEKISKGIKEKNKPAMDMSKLEGMLPDHYTYYIGKKNYFLYVVNSYNKNDELITSVMYKDIKINIGLKDDYFNLPVGVKVKEAASIDGTIKNMKESLKEKEKVK